MTVNGFEISDGILDLRGSVNEYIEDKAFWAARSVRSVLMPKGIRHIGDWAFAKCANLETVVFEDDFRPDLFGKDVFKGCNRLTSISFANMDEVTAHFLAMCANRLEFDSLIRSDDVGRASWYAKWDICLAAKIKSDDAEARMSAALCGEEDISYDGIGSVDGEMPGEGADFVSKEAYNRSVLCYMRLVNDRHISADTRRMLEEHIITNRFGEGASSSFFAIFEECDGDLSYLRIYLDTVRPDRQTLLSMIESLGSSHVAAKSFLIREAGGKSVLDDMML